MNSHRLWLVLIIAVASLVLGVGTTVALAAASHRTGRVVTAPWPLACATPALPGAVVDVTLTDMGPMGPMGPGMPWYGPYGPNNPNNWYGWQNGYPWPGMSMQRIFPVPSGVPAGQVSLRVHNTGALIHEVMVLPLSPGQYPGQRAIGANGRVNESGSLGEASRSCGADKGDGIAPGANAWTTLSLAPGRYELLCNIAGHYGAGMYSEVDAIANR
nr:sulfocyanin-like copper-binding protein [Mycobacterium intracellulare]